MERVELGRAGTSSRLARATTTSLDGEQACKGGSVYKFAVGSNNNNNRGHGAAELELELKGTTGRDGGCGEGHAVPEWRGSELLVGVDLCSKHHRRISGWKQKRKTDRRSW